MNWEEFKDLTVMRCFVCEEELSAKITNMKDKEVWFCKCESVRAIFKKNNARDLLYYTIRLPNYAAQITASRPIETEEFMITVQSWNQSTTFRSNNILPWFQDEHRMKNKVDSLMILK